MRRLCYHKLVYSINVTIQTCNSLLSKLLCVTIRKIPAFPVPFPDVLVEPAENKAVQQVSYSSPAGTDQGGGMYLLA